MASLAVRQPQEEQQEAALSETTAEPEIMPVESSAPAALPTYFARRKAAMAWNIGTRGRSIVLTQLCMGLASLWSAFSFIAFWANQDDCAGHVFSLKSWFLGSAIFQGVYMLTFLVTMSVVIYVSYARKVRHGDASLPGPPDCFMRLSVCFVVLPVLAAVWVVLGVVALIVIAQDGEAYEACNHGHEFLPFAALFVFICIWGFGSYFIIDAHGSPWLPGLGEEAPAGEAAPAAGSAPGVPPSAPAPMEDALAVAV